MHFIWKIWNDRISMLNLQDNKKGWLFDTNFQARRIMLKLPVAIFLVLHAIYFSSPVGLVDRNERPIVVCLYLLRESTPAAPREAASTLWKGGGWGCTGISYSPFYSVYSACGWGHETVPAWKLNVTRKRNVTIFRVSAGGSCFVASRLVSLLEAIVRASSRDSFYNENSNSDRKVWDSFSKPIFQFYFAHSRISYNDKVVDNCPSDKFKLK